MKIAIIGAGFGSLAAAFDLSKIKGNQIEIFDTNEFAGGLATGFKEDNWNWSFEEHYHHAFDTDKALKQFLSELGLRDQLVYKRAKSSTLYNGKIHQIDSPLSLLKFKEISFLSRLRTGAVLAFLKILPNGVLLEKFRASKFLPLTMGQESWRVIWEPLFDSKFGRFKNEVNLSWFWARVNPRTAALGYFNGGFKRLADLIVKKLKDAEVKFSFSIKVEQVFKEGNRFTLFLVNRNGVRTSKQYDLVISTLASPVFSKIIDLPELKQEKLVGLGAMTMLLRLRKKLLKDGTYWLNINEKNWPFVAIVEHDNYISSSNYGGESLVYLGRYLETSDPSYQKTAEELLADYRPYLKKIDPQFDQNLIEAKVFKAPFAQPISFVNQSRFLPKFDTSIKNLYWASMQHIYPFDRGINHAIASGRKLAEHVRIKTS
jgi:protoporphyrinogen oxidase